jgi:hypothetical protein
MDAFRGSELTHTRQPHKVAPMASKSSDSEKSAKDRKLAEISSDSIQEQESSDSSDASSAVTTKVNATDQTLMAPSEEILAGGLSELPGYEDRPRKVNPTDQTLMAPSEEILAEGLSELPGYEDRPRKVNPTDQTLMAPSEEILTTGLDDLSNAAEHTADERGTIMDSIKEIATGETQAFVVHDESGESITHVMASSTNDAYEATDSPTAVVAEQEEELGDKIRRRMSQQRDGPARKDPLIGTVIADRFTIQEKIGEGGMGAVYRARQRGMDRDVAIKVLLKSVAKNETVIRRFHLEALAVSKLKHPNTIQIFDFGEIDDEQLYIAMEFLMHRGRGSRLR